MASLHPGNDVTATPDDFGGEVARRFLAAYRAAAHRACEEERTGDAPINADLRQDYLRLWWSLSPGRQDADAQFAARIRSCLVQPWLRVEASVNRVHARLRLAPGEMLALSCWAEGRLAPEASDYARAYGRLERDRASIGLKVYASLASIARDARVLGRSDAVRQGWHTCAAELWLRLRLFAGCVYPLMPAFGTSIWRALLLPGAPRWPLLRLPFAVLPAPLPDLPLEPVSAPVIRCIADPELQVSSRLVPEERRSAWSSARPSSS